MQLYSMLTYLSMKKLSHRGLKRPPSAWTGVVQLAGALPHGWNGRRFDSCSAHIPRLGLWSLVLACMRGNPLTFLSHMGFSLPPSLSSSIPLSLKSVCPWVRIPKKKSQTYLMNLRFEPRYSLCYHRVPTFRITLTIFIN